MGKSGERVRERLCACFVVLLSTLHLLSWPEGGYAGIGTWKWRLFLLLAGGLCGLSLLVPLELRLVEGLPAKRKPAPPRTVELAALAYLALTALSALLSPYPGTLLGHGRRDGALTIGLYVGSFLLLEHGLRPRKWMLAVLGAAVCVFCGVGLLQLTGANPFGLYPGNFDFYGGGILYPGQYWSTAGNAGLSGAVLAAAAGAFLAAVVRGRRKRDWLFLIPLCLAVFSILKLKVEAAVAALAAGLLATLPFLVTDGSRLVRALRVWGAIALTAAVTAAVEFFDGGAALVPGRQAGLLALAGLLLEGGAALLGRWTPTLSPEKLCRALWSAVVIMVGGGLLAVYLYGGPLEGALGQLHQLLHGRWDDSFGSGRLYIWRQVWERLWERPLLGGGPDTLGLRGLEGFSRYDAALGYTVTAGIDAAHNEYLNIWVNQGLLALLAYLAAIGLSLVRCWRRREEDSAAIGGTAAVFYLIQAFFGISACAAAPYLWTALAVINSTKLEEMDGAT